MEEGEHNKIAYTTYQEFPDTKAVNFRNTLNQDPYEWKFPKRNETMYLSSIKDQDIGFNRYNMQRQSRSLFTKDIVVRKMKIMKNESFSLKNDDIDKSIPTKLHQPLNKAYYYLRNDDILGTKPSTIKFKTKREASNPLNPTYKLASFEPLDPIIPKFIRDSMKIEDINGSKPKSFQSKYGGRPTNLVSDIDGAKPKKDYQRNENQIQMNTLDVKDINEYRIFKTSRVTNPLTPEYTVTGEIKGEIDKIGEIKGSKSKILHPGPKKKLPLISDAYGNLDIDGSTVNTTGNKYIKMDPRKHYRVINETHDIPGAQTGTLKKGIQTNRHLNPIVPDYKYPGHIQDLDGYVHSDTKISGMNQQAKPEVVQGKENQIFESIVPTGEIHTNRSQKSVHESVNQKGPGKLAAHQNQSHKSNKSGAKSVSGEKANEISDYCSMNGSVQVKSEHSCNMSKKSGVYSIKSGIQGSRRARTPLDPISSPSKHDDHSLNEVENIAKEYQSMQKSSMPSHINARTLPEPDNFDEKQPLHKRINKEEYSKSVAKFYGDLPIGAADKEDEGHEKISKIMERIDNQKKTMKELEKSQKNVYTQTKKENRRTHAQKFDKFIQSG